MRNWEKNKSRLKRVNDKKLVLIFIVVLVCLSIFLLKNSQWMMKVNNQKITKEEYIFYQRLYPSLDKETLQEQIVKEKVQLQQAKKRKIQAIDTYSDLIKEVKKTNKENEEKIQKRQVIYGLKTYTEATYYTHSLSLTINQLKKRVTKDLSDSKIKKYYKENEQVFQTVDAKELYRVQASKEMLQKLRMNNVDSEQLERLENVSYKTLVLDESKLHEWLKFREEEFQVVNQLKESTWSKEFNDGETVWSYYCVSTQPGTVKPLSDVRESIRIKLEKDQYQTKVEKWVQQAKVETK